MDINEVIGKRIKQYIGASKRDAFIEELGWPVQSYYDAVIGRRTFRVADLVAIARASGVPAYKFVDASGLSESKTGKAVKTVELGEGAKQITSAELLDQVLGGLPTEPKGRTWRALMHLREALGGIEEAAHATIKAERELYGIHIERIEHANLPAYEWEGPK